MTLTLEGLSETFLSFINVNVLKMNIVTTIGPKSVFQLADGGLGLEITTEVGVTMLL